MLIGYARTSTLDQVAGYEAQIRDLERLGCEKVYQEQVSSVAQRRELDAALDFAREGDTFIVTRLDRLARSTGDLLRIAEGLKRKGVELRIVNLGIDTATATGKMMLTIIGAIAAFEREVMLERQREGIDAAKRKGVYKGRAPTVRRQADAILQMRASGMGAAEIAKRLKVGRASVYRVFSQVEQLAEAAE